MKPLLTVTLFRRSYQAGRTGLHHPLAGYDRSSSLARTYAATSSSAACPSAVRITRA